MVLINAIRQGATPQHGSRNSDSEPLVYLNLHGISPVLVPYGAYGKPLRYLVFDLNNLPRARREVSRKSEEQVLGDALLHGQAASAVALRATHLGIDGQRGNACKFFHPAAKLAG